MSDFGRGNFTTIATFAVTSLLTVAGLAFSGGNWANKQVMFIDAGLQATGTSNFTYNQVANELGVGGILATNATTTNATTTAFSFVSSSGTTERVINLFAATGAFTSSVTAPNVPPTASSTLATATTTAFYTNNTGRSQVVEDCSVTLESGTQIGTYFFNVGTSSNVGVTSTSPFISGMVAYGGAATGDVVTPSSTMNATSTFAWTKGVPAHLLLKNGESIVAKNVASTTAVGTLRCVFDN